MSLRLPSGSPALYASLARSYVRSAFEGLRQRRAFEEVETYAMFVGYERSGHSLLGALLNAHPDAVIAHELHALDYLRMGFARAQLFALILRRDAWFAASNNEWSGYTYHVPGGWQGRRRRLQVIGDKKGGYSTLLLRDHPDLLHRLAHAVRVPVRVLHVVRNPYDNISTLSRRNRVSLDRATDVYLDRCETNARILATHPEVAFHTVRSEDVIADPESELSRACTFLGLEPEPAYLAACASIVFDRPRATREAQDWPNDLRRRIDAAIARHAFLDGYTFEGA